MPTILVVADHTAHALSASTRSAITAALQISAHSSCAVHVLVAGHGARQVAEQAAAVPGVDRVLLADDASYTHRLAEDVAPLVVRLAAGCSHVLAPASSFGRNLMPRVAALLDVGQISEVTAVVGEDTFVRPVYAGEFNATVRCKGKLKVATIRTSAFSPAAAEGGNASIEPLQCDAAGDLCQHVATEVARSERPELDSARVVISGGKGLKSAENFGLLERLADRLGGAVGASRAAVDAGFVPNECQIGQSGKIVAPDLYIAVGLSGAVQHLAGMKSSKVIVAINSDPDAPIFKIADYGLVGDLFELLPQLQSELEKA
ncbi:MAG TPA: FAD-binding protein [Ramlibacter sp.]|nr:FAD-binding protein [Ramlibacter sp.]